MALTGPALETRLDLLIADLWQLASDFPDTDQEVIGVFMRAAFARGYIHALDDDGALMGELGYALPPKRADG